MGGERRNSEGSRRTGVFIMLVERCVNGDCCYIFIY